MLPDRTLTFTFRLKKWYTFHHMLSLDLESNRLLHDTSCHTANTFSPLPPSAKCFDVNKRCTYLAETWRIPYLSVIMPWAVSYEIANLSAMCSILTRLSQSMYSWMAATVSSSVYLQTTVLGCLSIIFKPLHPLWNGTFW
jgi:hypothetical protein